MYNKEYQRERRGHHHIVDKLKETAPPVEMPLPIEIVEDKQATLDKLREMVEQVRMPGHGEPRKVGARCKGNGYGFCNSIETELYTFEDGSAWLCDKHYEEYEKKRNGEYLQ